MPKFFRKLRFSLRSFMNIAPEVEQWYRCNVLYFSAFTLYLITSFKKYVNTLAVHDTSACLIWTECDFVIGTLFKLSFAVLDNKTYHTFFKVEWVPLQIIWPVHNLLTAMLAQNALAASYIGTLSFSGCW